MLKMTSASGSSGSSRDESSTDVDLQQIRGRLLIRHCMSLLRACCSGYLPRNALSPLAFRVARRL